jgi:hypothetical protein
MSHLLLASTTSWSGVAAARRKVGFPPTNPHTSRTRAAASQHAHPQQRTGRLPACLRAELVSVPSLAPTTAAAAPLSTHAATTSFSFAAGCFRAVTPPAMHCIALASDEESRSPCIAAQSSLHCWRACRSSSAVRWTRRRYATNDIARRGNSLASPLAVAAAASAQR